MRRKEWKNELAETVLYEHRQLNDTLLFLVRFVSVEVQLTPNGASDLARGLRRLHGHLERHFEHEEREGFFEDISRRLPFKATAIESLKNEHVEFLERVEGFICKVEQPRLPNGDALRENLDRFLKSYRNHEEAEHDLLQRAYYQDLGTGD